MNPKAPFDNKTETDKKAIDFCLKLENKLRNVVIGSLSHAYFYELMAHPLFFCEIFFLLTVSIACC